LGMQCQPHNDETLKTLIQTQKTDCVFYKQNISLINTIIRFINNKPRAHNVTNYTDWPLFAASNFFAHFVPHCTKLCNNDTKKDDTISCLLAFFYNQQNNHEKSYEYINLLQKSPSYKILLLKAQIYTKVKKPLPYSDLEKSLKTFLSKNNQSLDDQAIIANIASLTEDFFIESKDNLNLALKLITKFTELNNILPSIIDLVYHIESTLLNNKNPYLEEWKKKIITSQFFDKIKTHSFYDAKENYMIAQLLAINILPHPHEKMISYLIPLLNDPLLTPEGINEIKEYVGDLYYAWAESTIENKKLYLNLLDSAIQYGHNLAKNNKAIFLLKNSNDKDEIIQAIQFLEDSITDTNPAKNESLLALANAYLHYTTDTIPLNIDKAIEYLHISTSYKALEILTKIYTGKLNHLDSNITKEYSDITMALHCLSILINHNHNIIGNLCNRALCYFLCKEYDKALEDITAALNNKEINTPCGCVFKESLLRIQLPIFLKREQKNNTYTQSLKCIKQLKSLYNTQNNSVNLNNIAYIDQIICHIIEQQVTTDSAIELCSIAAESDYIDIIKNTTNSNITIEYQKNLANHLKSAAHNGNLNAQIIIFPYSFILSQLPKHEDIAASLNHSYRALSKPSIIKEKKIDHLIEFLQQLSNDGNALAYYILCYYYNNNNEITKLEAHIQEFSKATKPEYYAFDPENIMQNIIESCSSTLDKYAQRHIKTPNNGTIIHALAAFTLGSMLRFSKNIEDLVKAENYIKISRKSLTSKYKLEHYSIPARFLLGHIFYGNFIAITKKEKTSDFNKHKQE